MKKLAFIILSLCYSISFSQSMFTPLAPSVEIFPIAKSTSNPSDSTTFTLEAVSQIWCSANPGGG